MIKLKYTGKATVRVGSFGKFSPGNEDLTFSEEDAETLIRTGLFKKVAKPKPPKTAEPPEKKEEVKQ